MRAQRDDAVAAAARGLVDMARALLAAAEGLHDAAAKIEGDPTAGAHGLGSAAVALSDAARSCNCAANEALEAADRVLDACGRSRLVKRS